jgi:tetratricopeptide (TPR) repeat protein
MSEAATTLTGSPDPPPLRVEQALRLVPDVEALAPLRALLLSCSRQDEAHVWASSSPYLTVGKRLVHSTELERQLPEALDREREHLARLYQSVVTALEAEQRGETPAAVQSLLDAGAREEAIGRHGPARAWYEAAGVMSEQLSDRGPELTVLNRLGALELEAANPVAAARLFQRSLALAESGSYPGEAMDACLGLGAVSLAEGNLFGAQAWYQRGLQLADSDPLRSSRLHHQLALVSLARTELAQAEGHLARARGGFERLGDFLEMARTLNTQGRLDWALGRSAQTSAAYREALAWCRRSGGAADLEAEIRLNLAEVYLADGRILEAEQEARRAEDLAIGQNVPRLLVPIYLFLGRLRGLQRDGGGFVFFEKAIELCRELAVAPALEGQAYREYAAFRDGMGERAEAAALLECAAEILTASATTEPPSSRS